MEPECTLPLVFRNILKQYFEVKNFHGSCSDKKFKDLISRCCTTCKDAVKMINDLEIFSKNESLDDLATAYIRYLTLPAFTGFFICQKPDREERLTTLQLAQNFYKEFLTLVTNYDIPHLPKYDHGEPSGDGGNKSSAPAKPPVPRNPNALREEKIRAYKEKQALERRLLKFVDVAAPNVDEEVLREESLALVCYWAYAAIEDLRMIDEEIAILSRFSANQDSNHRPPTRPNTKTQQVQQTPVGPPLLITREKICATVFGAGYPSVPTMTLDQFVDLQKRQLVKALEVEEPAFIKRFRTQAGMKPAEADIESKRAALALDDEEPLRDRADEAPQVVVSAESGVSEKEAKAFVRDQLMQSHEVAAADEDEEPTAEEIRAEKEGRILFRKVKPKSINNRQQQQEEQKKMKTKKSAAASNNKVLVHDDDDTDGAEELDPVEKRAPAKMTTSVDKKPTLSFNYDEEEEEEG